MKTVMLTFAVQIPDDSIVNYDCSTDSAVQLIAEHGSSLIAISCRDDEEYVKGNDNA